MRIYWRPCFEAREFRRASWRATRLEWTAGDSLHRGGLCPWAWLVSNGIDLGRAPWPNHQQVNVSIIPPEHEAREKAQARPSAAGAGPYLSLTEAVDAFPGLVAVGIIKPHCPHACVIAQPMEAPTTEWAEAQVWAQARWARWLESSPSFSRGVLTFGPERVSASRPGGLQAELEPQKPSSGIR